MAERRADGNPCAAVAAPARADSCAPSLRGRHVGVVVAMTDERTGLPADSLKADGTRSVQTSTTNIGAYMWSALVAEDLRIIGHVKPSTGSIARCGRSSGWSAIRRAASTSTGTTTQRREADHLAAERRAADTDPLVGRQRLAGRRPARGGEPRARAAGARATDLRLDELRLLLPGRRQPHPVPLRAFHRRGGVLLRHDHLREPDRQLHRDREGRDPAAPLLRRVRSFPESCDWSWVETRPVGFTRTYFGVDVYEGAYPYNGTRVTPSWGGSMFEALMPPLFVPEDRWGPGAGAPTTRSRSGRRSITG